MPRRVFCLIVLLLFPVLAHAQDKTRAVPDLIRALQEKDARARLDAVIALGQIGPAASAAVPNLVALLTTSTAERDAPLRLACARSLWKMGSSCQKIVPALVGCVRNASMDPAPAVLTLADMGRPAAEAAPALWELWDSADADLSIFVAHALLRVAPDSAQNEKLVPCMVALLSDSEQPQAHLMRRMLAAQILWKLGPQASGACNALQHALRDPDEEVRMAAAGALTAIRPQDERALVTLSASLRRLIATVKQNAARPADSSLEMDWKVFPIYMIGRLGSRAWEAEPCLKAADQSPYAEVRAAAQEALRRIR